MDAFAAHCRVVAGACCWGRGVEDGGERVQLLDADRELAKK